MSSTPNQLLNRTLIVLGAGLAIATGVVFAAHESGSGDPGAQQSAGPAKAVDKVPIKDFLFKPDAITVPVGTSITFTNEDSAPHTATSGQPPGADGVFDTGNLTKGESKRVTVSEAGTFAYYCQLHPFMKGTVIVK
jgi:plastocyanin